MSTRLIKPAAIRRQLRPLCRQFGVPSVPRAPQDLSSDRWPRRLGTWRPQSRRRERGGLSVPCWLVHFDRFAAW